MLLATQAAPLLHLPFLHPQASIASAALQLLNSGGPCVIAHCRTYGTEEKRHLGRNCTAGRRRNRAESVQLQGLGVRSSGTKMARVSASFGRAGILGSGSGNCWSCCFLVYWQNYFLEVYIGHSWRCSNFPNMKKYGPHNTQDELRASYAFTSFLDHSSFLLPRGDGARAPARAGGVLPQLPVLARICGSTQATGQQQDQALPPA